MSNGQGEENNIGHDEPEATAEDAQAQVDPSFCAAAERAAVATTAEPAAPRELYGSREAFRAMCAATWCERERTWVDLPDSDDPDAEEITGRRDRADESLHEALHAVKVAFFPREEDECCVYFEIAARVYTRPAMQMHMWEDAWLVAAVYGTKTFIFIFLKP